MPTTELSLGKKKIPPFCTGTVGLTLVSFPDDFSFGRMKSLACETRLTSCGAFGPTTLLLPTVPHTQRCLATQTSDNHIVYTTAINS